MKENILLSVVKENEILIEKWKKLFNEKDSDRYYDDFLGFFEECIKENLDINSDSVDALILFLNKMKEILGDIKFFNIKGYTFIEALKIPIIERLKDKKVLNYELLLKIDDFFEKVNAKFIRDYIQKRNEIAQVLAKELESREAPVSEIEDGVLLVVLVGILDSNRVMKIIDLILNKMERVDTNYVIVDISNIFDINTETANQILKLSNAIRYMGAEAYISGINSNIAKRLTHLAINFGELKTFRDIKQALKEIRKN